MNSTGRWRKFITETLQPKALAALKTEVEKIKEHEDIDKAIAFLKKHSHSPIFTEQNNFYSPGPLLFVSRATQLVSRTSTAQQKIILMINALEMERSHSPASSSRNNSTLPS